MSTSAEPDDLEIYLHKLDPEAVSAWLAGCFPAATLTSRRRGHALELTLAPVTGHRGDSGSLTVLVLAKAADGYTSCWFRNGPMPWADDLAAARAARMALQCPVRCSTGPWQTDAEELWWHLDAAGEQRLPWPDA